MWSHAHVFPTHCPSNISRTLSSVSQSCRIVNTVSRHCESCNIFYKQQPGLLTGSKWFMFFSCHIFHLVWIKFLIKRSKMVINFRRTERQLSSRRGRFLSEVPLLFNLINFSLGWRCLSAFSTLALSKVRQSL